ncbi:hypothetical protein BDV10DRAFT_184232 [Aspergillus recurvatus]
MQDFPRFSDLPAELRIQIWRETCPAPGVHVFDVCIPSAQTGLRVSQIQEELKSRDVEIEPPSSVFLDQVMVSQTQNRPASQRDTNKQPPHACRSIESKCSLTADPSTYLISDSVRQSCPEASFSLQPPASASNPNNPNSTNLNSIHLPLRGQGGKQIHYNNISDILHLRFGPSVSYASPFDPGMLNPNDGSEDAYLRVFKSSLSDALLYPWSTGFMLTLQNARSVALDIADLQLEMGLSPRNGFAREAVYQEVKCLAARLARGLEALYVVDYCVGRCRGSIDEMNGLDKTRGELSRNSECNAGEKDPDVFYGNGVTYREVFSLESLGWSEDTPVFIVLEVFAEAIREQQREEGKGCFQGVRVLACEKSG